MPEAIPPLILGQPRTGESSFWIKFPLREYQGGSASEINAALKPMGIRHLEKDLPSKGRVFLKLKLKIWKIPKREGGSVNLESAKR